MSKRTQSETPTEDGATKRPRLDIQEQIKRAGILAEQLRDTVGKDNVDSKTTAANQIASEELVRIFESMQEQTAETSNSVDDLILAQIKLELQSVVLYLYGKCNDIRVPLSKEIGSFMTALDATAKESFIQDVGERMKGVKTADYAVKIKLLIKEMLTEEFGKNISLRFAAVLSYHNN